MVRGVAPTLDPMLQARMFAYPDAARYRLGANYQQLPCNRAVSAVYCPYERDGAMRYETNYGDDPNYVRSQLKRVRFEGELGKSGHSTGCWHKQLSGMVKAYTSEVTDADFEQASMMWGVLKKTGQDEDFVGNVVDGNLGEALPELQQKAVGEYQVRWMELMRRNVHQGRPEPWEVDLQGPQGVQAGWGRLEPVGQKLGPDWICTVQYAIRGRVAGRV